jgi:prevent-host-death family protein
MNKITGVTDLLRNFKHVFDDVVKEKAAHVLTRNSRPEAVLLPYEEYVRLTNLSESEILARFNQTLTRMKAANAKISDAEIEADLMQATRTIRKVKRTVSARPKRVAHARRR